MNKTTKRKNWEEGTAALEILVARDFEVQPFSDIHFRVNGRLDIWPSTRRFYDTKSHEKGVYDDLEKFVINHFCSTKRKQTMPQVISDARAQIDGLGSVSVDTIVVNSRDELVAALANPQATILISDEGLQAVLNTLLAITALAATVMLGDKIVDAVKEVTHHAISEHYQITGEASVELGKRKLIEFKGKVVLTPTEKKSHSEE